MSAEQLVLLFIRLCSRLIFLLSNVSYGGFAKDRIINGTELLHVLSKFLFCSVPADVAHKKRPFLRSFLSVGLALLGLTLFSLFQRFIFLGLLGLLEWLRSFSLAFLSRFVLTLDELRPCLNGSLLVHVGILHNVLDFLFVLQLGHR